MEKTRGELSPIDTLTGLPTIDALLDAYSTCRAQNPWTEGLVLPLAAAIPERTADGWLAIDVEQRSIRLDTGDEVAWTLAALSAACPSTSSVTTTEAHCVRSR